MPILLHSSIAAGLGVGCGVYKVGVLLDVWGGNEYIDAGHAITGVGCALSFTSNEV